MKLTKAERKKMAVECMKALNIDSSVIWSFYDKKSIHCYYNSGIDIRVRLVNKELQHKIDEIERKYKCSVYAVTREITSAGELYDLLVVPNDKEDLRFILNKTDKAYSVLAYVYNKTIEDYSEFGHIGIASNFNHIYRIW